MSLTYPTIRDVLLIVMFTAGGGWVIVRSIQKADDPGRMVFKWIMTAVVIAVAIWKVLPLVAQGGYTGAFADPEGYVWEVAHNPDWTLAEDGSVRLG